MSCSNCKMYKWACTVWMVCTDRNERQTESKWASHEKLRTYISRGSGATFKAEEAKTLSPTRCFQVPKWRGLRDAIRRGCPVNAYVYVYVYGYVYLFRNFSKIVDSLKYFNCCPTITTLWTRMMMSDSGIMLIKSLDLDDIGFHLCIRVS